tara:strand:+ start:271 stop:603 length:333 start_codon:yes stop_codon:yes gene_type:complete
MAQKLNNKKIILVVGKWSLTQENIWDIGSYLFNLSIDMEAFINSTTPRYQADLIVTCKNHWQIERSVKNYKTEVDRYLNNSKELDELHLKYTGDGCETIYEEYNKLRYTK